MSEEIENIYTDILGTILIAYTQGVEEKDRPSHEELYTKYVALKENLKKGNLVDTIKTPFEKGFIRSVINAAGVTWVNQDTKLKWVIYVNPFTYNFTFGRGLYVDDVLYALPLREDCVFGLPQETIGNCWDYEEFLKLTDEEIEKACAVRREEILKHENIETKASD